MVDPWQVYLQAVGDFDCSEFQQKWNKQIPSFLAVSGVGWVYRRMDLIWTRPSLKRFSAASLFCVRRILRVRLHPHSPFPFYCTNRVSLRLLCWVYVPYKVCVLSVTRRIARHYVATFKSRAATLQHFAAVLPDLT